MTRKDWLRNIMNVYFLLAAFSGVYYFSESWRKALGIAAGALLVDWITASWHWMKADDE